jgi:acetyl esterase
MASEPHPQAQAFLDRVAGPPPYALSIEGTRTALADLLTTDDPLPVAEVRDLPLSGPDGSLPVRMYADADGPLPVAVYYHGGGWVRGNLDTHDGICRHLAREAGCLVVSVDYRRPPEHPFPAAVEDAYAAVEWVDEHAGTVGGDPDRIAVAGDSAGGNLAAAVAGMSRDRDGPDLAHQLLLYPVLEHAFDTPSYEAFAEGYLPTRATMRWYWEQYLADPIDGHNPYASPLRARSFEGLAPATVLTAGFDPLRDEGRAYADRLREAGVPVDHLEYEEMIHGFLSFPAAIDRANEARDAVADALCEGLEP